MTVFDGRMNVFIVNRLLIIFRLGVLCKPGQQVLAVLVVLAFLDFEGHERAGVFDLLALLVLLAEAVKQLES